jgi:hypothetical protein
MRTKVQKWGNNLAVTAPAHRDSSSYSSCLRKVCHLYAFQEEATS